MNTPEKYVCAYIVDSLTGISGSNPERVAEVLANSDFSIDDPFLNLVYQMVRYNPQSTQLKEAIAGLVIGQILLTNEHIADAFEKTIVEEVERRLSEREGNRLEYKIEDGQLSATATVEKNGKCASATIVVPATLKDFTIGEFKKRFPDAKIIELL